MIRVEQASCEDSSIHSPLPECNRSSSAASAATAPRMPIARGMIAAGAASGSRSGRPLVVANPDSAWTIRSSDRKSAYGPSVPNGDEWTTTSCGKSSATPLSSESGASVTSTSASASCVRQDPDWSVLPTSSDSRSSEIVSPSRSSVGGASRSRESVASKTATSAPQRANSRAQADAGTSRLYSTTRIPLSRLPSDTRSPLRLAYERPGFCSLASASPTGESWRLPCTMRGSGWPNLAPTA